MSVASANSNPRTRSMGRGISFPPKIREEPHGAAGRTRYTPLSDCQATHSEDSKTPTSPALAREPRRRLLAVRVQDCSRLRLAYSERTPSLTICQYPLAFNSPFGAVFTKHGLNGRKLGDQLRSIESGADGGDAITDLGW